MEGSTAIVDGLTPTPSPARREDEWRDECGVFGVIGHPQAADLSWFALFALQHRGEESAGIVTLDGLTMNSHRGMGLLPEAVPAPQLEMLRGGDAGIAHVRYSTAGASQLVNAQPLVFRFQHGNLALAHNGNLTNADDVRGELERAGAIFQTSSDTEVIAHLLVRDGHVSQLASLRRALARVSGGFALAVLTDDVLYAARDPHGLRPLVLGTIDGAWCVASESCAFDTIGATLVRDIEPGELVAMRRDGTITSHRFAPRAARALCTFEYIYFSRPDSQVDGHNVHAVRKRLGELLHDEHPAQADVVIGVPDSSIAAAMGYAAASGIPFDLGLVKSHYTGRSFIQPSQELRDRRVRLKLNAMRNIVAGKRIVMVDDSLVRGTTSRRIVALLRDAGATAVHVRIASPPVAHPCHYGIDTARRSELVAARLSVEGIRAEIGADSLAFLSERVMMRAFTEDDASSAVAAGHCAACFTGRYPEARPAVGLPEPAREQAAAAAGTPLEVG